MRQAESFLSKICVLYPPPEKVNTVFGEDDIKSFENILGTELPSDYYEFLKIYGFGSFSDYFYINNPFVENGTEIFISENAGQKEIYDFLDRDNRKDIHNCLDCKFVNGQVKVFSGNPALVEYMRTEVIDDYTRSKIIAFGDHYSYAFYPDEPDGLIFLGHTDDMDFFYRYSDGKQSIVVYDEYYYEFDMTFTEFVYNYLTAKIKLPMWNDETDWEFVSYE